MNILPLFLFLLFVPEHRSSTDPTKTKQNTASLNRTQGIALQSGLTPLDCTTVIMPIDHHNLLDL